MPHLPNVGSKAPLSTNASSDKKNIEPSPPSSLPTELSDDMSHAIISNSHASGVELNIDNNDALRNPPHCGASPYSISDNAGMIVAMRTLNPTRKLRQD